MNSWECTSTNHDFYRLPNERYPTGVVYLCAMSSNSAIRLSFHLGQKELPSCSIYSCWVGCMAILYCFLITDYWNRWISVRIGREYTLLWNDIKFSLVTLLMAKDVMFVVKSIGFWSLSETIVQLIYHNVSWMMMLYKTDKLDGF